MASSFGPERVEFDQGRADYIHALEFMQGVLRQFEELVLEEIDDDIDRTTRLSAPDIMETVALEEIAVMTNSRNPSLYSRSN